MKRIFTIMVAGLLLTGAISCQPSLEMATLTVNTEKIEPTFEGLVTTIGVKSTRDWTASADVDWISLTPSSAEAFETWSYMIVTVAPNPTGFSRTGTISVTTTSGELVQSVTVTQGENSEIISTAEKFVQYLTKVAAREATNTYRLGGDIDLSGVILPEVEEMIYIFDGQGHALKNWTSSSSLFKKIAASGAVKNLILDSSCNLTMPGEGGNFGFIASDNYGTLENITNNANITVAALARGAWGSISGYTYNGGQIISCTNTGSISYEGPAQTDDSIYMGGVSGRIASSETGSTAITGCVNTGNITIKLTTQADKSFYFAGITGSANSYGKVIECTNKGNVKVNIPGCSVNALVSGIVCYHAGESRGNVNEGDITLASESADNAADGPVKGAGVAGISSYQGSGNGNMSDCHNKGAITLRAGYSLGQTTVGSMTKYTSGVGGIVAYAYKCTLEGCSNSGKITSHFANIDNAASVYQTTSRQSLGGIIASSYGNITSCTNSGEVKAYWVTSTHNAALAKNFVTQAGGISGGDYQGDQISTSIVGCTNEGAVNITCDSSGSNNAYGGIVGWPAKEAATVTGVIDGCVNRGVLTVDGFSKGRMGGIVGAGGEIKNCTNYGKVHLKGGHVNCAVGGIAGYRNFKNTTDSANYGDVTSDILITGTVSTLSGVGAVFGGCGNTAMTISGCKVDCKVTVPDGCNVASMTAGLIGQDKAVTTKLEIGTAASPIKIKGSFNGTAITADNYSQFIKYSSYAGTDPNVTFNVVYGD